MPLKAGSYSDNQGNSDTRPTQGTLTVSQPAPHDVRIAGIGAVTVKATAQVPHATAIALLYDVDEDGSARVITRGAARLTGGTTKVELWPADWLLPAGHRLLLQLSGDDGNVYQPTWTGSTVTVTGGALTLPLLTRSRPSNLTGESAKAQAGVARATFAPGALAGRESRADFGRALR